MAMVEGGFRKLPASIIDRKGRSKNVVRMGLFQEIHRAWITLDTDINDREWPRSDNLTVGGTRVHDLILWDYNSDEVVDPNIGNFRINDEVATHVNDEMDDGSGLVKYGLSSISFKSWVTPVVSVGLVVPRGDTFEPSVKYLLAVCTADEVTVLALHFDLEMGRPGPVPSIHSTMKIVHHPDGFTFPTDGIRFQCVAGSAHGRIFLGGSDGCIHEVETNTDEPISGGGSNSDDSASSLTSSFNISGVIGGTATAVSGYVGSILGIAYLESMAKKMKRTNREITTGMAMIKSLLGSQSALGYRISHICVDHERNLLYTVSIDGRLSVYSLGAAGNEFVLVSRIECMDSCAKKHFTDKGADADARLFEERKASKELRKVEKDIVLSSAAENGLDTFLQTIAPVQSKAWPIVALNVVKVSESKRIHLVATALSGARFYFTTLSDEKFKEPMNPPNVFFENQRKHNDGINVALMQQIQQPRPPTAAVGAGVQQGITSPPPPSSSSLIPLADAPIMQLPKREVLPGCDLRLVHVRLPPESLTVERRNNLNGRESIASLVVPGTTTFLAVPSLANGDRVVSLTRDWLNNKAEEDPRSDKSTGLGGGGGGSLAPTAGELLGQHHLRPASLAYETNQASLGRPVVLHQSGMNQQQLQHRLSKLECVSNHLTSYLPSKSLVYAIGEVNREPSAVLDSCIFTPSGALLLPDGETAPLPYRSFDLRRGGGGLQLLEPGSGPLSVAQFDALPVTSGAAATASKKKRERDDAAAATAFAQDDLVGAIIKQRVLEESSVPTRYSHLVRRRIWASGGSHDAEPLVNDLTAVPSISGGTFDLSPPELSLTHDLRASAKSFVILTSDGVHRIRKVRVIDQLASILSHVSNSPHSPALQPKRIAEGGGGGGGGGGSHDANTLRKPIQTAELRNPLLESFFTKMPVREEAFAQIAAVACGFSSKSQLSEWRGPRGSRPADDACRSLSDGGGGERDTARRSLRAFGGDPSWKLNSNAEILAAKNGMTAFSRDDSGYSSRDLTFSPKFGGLTLLLSRLLRPFWRKTLFVAPPGKQTFFAPSAANTTLAVALGSKPATFLSGSSLNSVKVERELLVPRFTSAECLELHMRLSAFIELFEETFEHALKVEGNEEAYKQIVRSLGSSTAKTLGRDAWINNMMAPMDDPSQRALQQQQQQPRSDIEIEGTKKRKAMEMEILHQFLVLRLVRRAREATALMAAVADPANGVSHSLSSKGRSQAPRENDELIKMSKMLTWRDLITLPSGEVFADRLFSLTLKMLLAEQVKRESKISGINGLVGGGGGGIVTQTNQSFGGGGGIARFFGFGTSSLFSGDVLKASLVGGGGGGGSSAVVASATQLSSFLRRASPGFFSEGQALLVQAKDITNKACRHASSVPAESKRLFAEAQDLLSQAIKALSVAVLLRRWDDIKSITDQFCASEFYSGVLAVTMSVAMRCANNDASALDASLPPDFIAPAEGSFTLARKKAYRTVTDMLEKRCEQERVDANSSGSVVMKLSIDESIRGASSRLLPQSALIILSDALSTRDRGFHFSLYEWLIEKDLHELLIEADTDYVEHYLDSRAKSAANSANDAYGALPSSLDEVKKHLSSRRKYKEWLALFHANKGRYDLASQVFYALTQERWDNSQMDAATNATTRRLNPELHDRTHCLNRAIENAERMVDSGESYLRVWKNDVKVLQVQGSLLMYGESYDKRWRATEGGSYEPLFSEDVISSLKYEIYDVDRIIRFAELKNLPEFAIDVLDIYRNPQHRKMIEALYMGDLETGELGILGQIASAALGVQASDEIRKLSPHLMPHDVDIGGARQPPPLLHFDSQKVQSVISALQSVCKYYSTKFRPDRPLGGGGGDFSFPLTSIIAYLEIERALDGDGYRKYVEEEGGQYDFLWVATGCFGEGVGLSVREDAYRKLMSELWREAATTRTTTNSNQARSSIRPFVRLVIVWTKLVSIWANRSLRHAHSLRSHRDVIRSYREVGVDPDALEPHKKDLLREVKSLQDRIRHLTDIVQKNGAQAIIVEELTKELTEAPSLLEDLRRKIEETPDLSESAFNPNRSSRQSRFGQHDLSYGGFE